MSPTSEEGRAWSVLSTLHQQVPSAVLLGGWATWLHTRGPMSDDIDLIVTRADLAQLWSRLAAEVPAGPRAVDVSGQVGHVGHAGEIGQASQVGQALQAVQPAAGEAGPWYGRLEGVRVGLHLLPDGPLGVRLPVTVGQLVPYTQMLYGWPVLSRSALFVATMAGLLDRVDGPTGRIERRRLLVQVRSGLEAGEVIDILYESCGVDHEVQPAILREAFTYLVEPLRDKTERRHMRTLAATWILAAQSRAALR